MNKFEEIKKIKKGCGEIVWSKRYGSEKCISLNLCPTCQAKLQTWKQALTYQLKELERDILDWNNNLNWTENIKRMFFNSTRPKCNSVSMRRIDNRLIYLRQKLAQKQKDKAEIEKELEEIGK